MKNKTLAYFISGLLLSIVFLWYSLKDIHFDQLKYAYLHENPDLAALMLLAFVSFFFLKAFRWKLLLTPVGSYSTRQLINPLILGTSVHYLTAAVIGDLVRMLSASKTYHIRKSSVLATIFLERILDSLTLILLILTLGLSHSSFPSSLTNGITLLFILSLIFLAVVLFVVFLPTKLEPMIQPLLKWLPAYAQLKISGTLHHAVQGLNSVASLSLISKIAAVSVLQWLVMGSAHYLSLIALDIEAPYYSAFLIMGLIVCGFILPNLPGQIGLIEFCYVIALGHFGVAPSLAFAAAILYHVFLYVLVFLWSLLYARTASTLIKHLVKKFQIQDTHEL